MYKQNEYQERIVSVTNLELNISIPFDPANTDYQTFKADLAEGVELQDAEGNVMSGEAVAAFLKSLAEA